MRSPFVALIKKDLKGYFDQPTGYILVIIFVVVLPYGFFQSAFLTLEASLRPLFAVDFIVERPSLPWLLVFFVPAATMRLLAEEQRDGTLEILLTQPIRGWIVLIAKFLAGLVFVSTAILGTLGIPIALETAGDLDWGAVAAQYIGTLFLAASFVAIGLFTSSLTRNQIVSFVLGLSVTAVLMVIGLEQVSVTLPDRVSTLVQALSPLTHFSSIARGVIDLRDVLYFVALVSTFLSATFLMVRGRTLSHRSPQYRNLQLGVAGLIVLSLLIGWFGSSIGGRLDLTADKQFTLSAGTTRILSDLDDLLTVELYESDDPTPGVSLVARDVNDFLEDFAASSDGNVKLVSRSPDDDEEVAAKAQLAGVFPRQFSIAGQTEFQSKVLYLGLVMTYADRREVIPFIGTFDGFEYQLASLAYKMVPRDRKTVAFLTGSGEKSKDAQLRTFAGFLGQQYEVIEVEVVRDAPPELGDVDVLIIAGPTERVPDIARDALHSYLEGGGKAMVLIESVEIVAGPRALPNLNSFADFVTRYGIIVEDNLVFDLRSNDTVSFQTQIGSILQPYPYWVLVPVVDEKVAGEVQSAVLPWASSIGITESEVGRLEIIPLLETTEFSAIDFNYGNVSFDSPVLGEVTEQNYVQSLVAVAVTRAESAAGADGDGTGSFRLVVVADSDWVDDGVVSRTPQNLGLALNLVDWLAQEDALAAIRSKVVASRDLVFTSTHKDVARFANILGVPLGFVAIGLLRYTRRRGISLREYGHEQ